ncbi:nucleotidyltransferase [Priestia koreensis]|uniref:nucleotidyltransferase n=1 Tax=Priestia koreensis TaxID=284581 RepID=UPI00203AE4BD|nr:nucleotidyltransferase [Priestia koreensis]MCM3003885.1 nucleotidyltransferase [Priestia koreensis]
MKATGIIVEYNPFHNGHDFHVHESKKQTEADCMIGVMSGHFLQRGEPALLSKWYRTEMALGSGVDLIVELPYVYATQQADTFAAGAVAILNQLQVESICFGSEDGRIEPFQRAVQFTDSSQPSEHVKSLLKEGYSYPKALWLALQTTEDSIDLSQPNNILGYAYVKAIIDQHTGITPHTIKRTQAHYHDVELPTTPIASATSIRKSLHTQSSIEEISPYVPAATTRLLEDYITTYGGFHDWEQYFPLLKYKLLTMTPSQLADIYEIEEGIEYRLLDANKRASTFAEFMSLVKTKRYTWTRIQRMCVHILTHTMKEEMKPFLHVDAPPYVRVLGMTKKGQEYLRLIKKKIEVPLVTKISKKQADTILRLDLKATYVYGMSLPEPLRSQFSMQDFTTPPIILS